MRAGGIFGGDSLGSDEVLAVPCKNTEVIEDVQTLLKTKSDGVWKCADAAALTKTGRSFLSFAPDCTSPFPQTPAPCTGADLVGPATVDPSTPATVDPKDIKAQKVVGMNLTTGGVLTLIGLTGLVMYALWPKKMTPNQRRKARSTRQTWDLLWENFIAAKRSGNKQRILDTAALCEQFDRSHGWSPTVTVAKVKREHGW